MLYRVLDALAHGPAVVPAHWRLEVVNAILFGEGKGGLSPSDVLRFFSLLESLSFITDTQTASHSLTRDYQPCPDIRTHFLRCGLFRACHP